MGDGKEEESARRFCGSALCLNCAFLSLERGGENVWKRKAFQSHSQSLLKATGATVGAAALIGGGVLRALGPDEGAFAEEPEDQTKCRVGCCWTCVYCQYEAHVRDGKIVKLSPIEGGSPRVLVCAFEVVQGCVLFTTPIEFFIR